MTGAAGDVERLKELYDEWARGDYSRSDIFDPAMTMETFGMGEPISAASYEEFVVVMRDWLGAWERPLTIRAEEYVESGDRILVLIDWAGRGKESGAAFESRGAHLWTFRDGRVIRFETYRDRGEARDALPAE